MPSPLKNEYFPDVVDPPGDTLIDVLTECGMSQAELADRMGRPRKTVNEIVKGKAEITPETALQLERVLGTPASFWTNLERHYREHLARQAEEKDLEAQLAWAEAFPVRQMEKMGWIREPETSTKKVRLLLSFFGVSSPSQWKSQYEQRVAAFRLARANKPDPYALTAWFRQCERVAHEVVCRPFDVGRFRRTLETVKQLTNEEDIQVALSQLSALCAECGVAVIVVPELRGSRVCGATRWLGPQKAAIFLSLRYKSNDQLWFTFFHESAHILLHGKKDVFVEVANASSGSQKLEDEANGWAAEQLIPRTELQRFLRGPITEDRVRSFSRELGIAPGIVVGRLQHHEHIHFSELNEFKVFIKFTHED